MKCHGTYLGLPRGTKGKESACNAGDVRGAASIPGSGTFPGGGHGNALQDSCLENPMDRGAWQAALMGHNESDHDSVTEHRSASRSVIISASVRVAANTVLSFFLMTDTPSYVCIESSLSFHLSKHS